MKVLFAVNDEKDAEAITRVYQEEYKEIISSKTVYYFNAIIKELQKDKTYDRIVISEDLEMFANNNYQAIDKFIFEKMDTISDEATNTEGNDIPIILLCMDRRTKNDPLLLKLFGLGLYNILVGQDRSIQKVCSLMYKPRTKKEAKLYYRVETENINYIAENKNNGVSETEIQNILNHYKRIGDNIPKCVQSFDSIVSQYSKEQIKLIVQVLPDNVKVILEENSDLYRKIMGIKGKKIAGTSQLRKTEYVEKEIGTGNRLTKPVIIPTAVSAKKVTKIQNPEKLKIEQERIARQKAEEEARRKEQERIARQKAEEEARKKEQERIARQKAEEEVRRKEQERIARQKAEEEARRKEQERIAKEKAEEKMEKENNSQTVKRGRGRPRKNPIVEEVPIKKKRGRPRKNPIVEESLSTQDTPKLEKEIVLKGNISKIDDDNNKKIVSLNNYYEENDDLLDKELSEDDDYDEENNNNTYNDEEEYDENYDIDVNTDNEDEDIELPGFEDYNEDKDINKYEQNDNDEYYDDIHEDYYDEDDDYDYYYDDNDDNDDNNYDLVDEEVEEDTIPGFDDEDEEVEEDTLPGSDDEDEEVEEDTLPGFDDEDEEVEEDTLPGFDDEDEEVEEDTLPGFEDEDEEVEEDTLPGFEDEDEEVEEDTLPGFDDEDEEVEEDTLPGFDEDEDDEEVEENIEKQHNGSFKKINNKNYRYDNDLANSIKDLQETEKNTSYNIDTDNLITSDQKIVSFVGTTKNGTSFIVNNLAELYANKGIRTAILDLTKNKNSYYIYTNNEDELREKAHDCLEKLRTGIADGVKVNRNLTVFTALPSEDDSLDDVTNIIQTLLENYTIVLLDCDFETDVRYFKASQEIYLVQSLDVLTIQPLTAFLRDLKVKGILETNKLRIVINKSIKINSITDKILIGGMSVYNDPAMTYMTELFDRDTIKYTTLPFEDQVYVKYLEGLVNCKISSKGYSKNFMSKLNKLSDMVYPTINAKKNKKNYNDYSKRNKKFEDSFSKNISSTLDKMRRKY